MKPVNKVPYNGPQTYTQIIELIAKDAQEKGWDFIKPNIVNSVIQRVFSVNGGLSGVPHFVLNSIKRFGKWLPNPEQVRKRERYYVDRKIYKQKFSYQLHLNRAMLKRAKAAYKKYYFQELPEIKMGYRLWMRATGRTRKLDRAYAKLNKIRKDWMKKEKEVYQYITIKERKKKFKRK